MKKIPLLPRSLHSAILLSALALGIGLVGTTASVVAHADDDDPELAFNGHCRECHAFDKGDNRIGPTLYGVVGRKAGTVPGFDYSESLKDSGITWNVQNLDQWITNPNAVVPGNNMGAIFSGLSDKKQRALIIKFLASDTKKKTGGN
ncbi:c-type cytochrome [Hyphomicrobium sp. DY-1]|uniref:c-type cytochrome n=1 Tax=Hyphomicrobium sp. DY-1 TaxID=3075650 RepID=UPI0039C4E294